MEDRKKYIWKQISTVNVLHQELASLYRTKSTDGKRIRILWNAIEEREALLFLEGVDL
jgi:hypothetical protein